MPFGGKARLPESMLENFINRKESGQ
jgi:hypothetical protein